MITGAKIKTSGGWLVTFAGRGDVHVPNDPANREYQALQSWVSAGGIVSPADTEPPAATRRNRIRELVQLHSDRAGLIIERDYWTSQSSAPKAAACQNLIDDADTRIAEIRTRV